MAVMRVIIAVAIVFAGDMVEQVKDVDAAPAAVGGDETARSSAL